MEISQLLAGNDEDDEVQLWMMATYAYAAPHFWTGQFESSLKSDAPRLDEHWKYADPQSDMATCATRWAWKAFEYIYSTPSEIKAKKRLAPTNIRDGSKSIWNTFKLEFHSLVCTDDHRYDDLRQKISKLSGPKSQFTITSAVAGAIAAHLGVVSATILTPASAILVLVGLRLGRNVLCEKLSVPGFEPIGLRLGYDPRVKKEKPAPRKRKTSSRKAPGPSDVV